MAEAHSAVAFSLSVTHDGFNLNFDREVLHLIWLSGKRSWRKRGQRIYNNVRCGIYPGSIKGLTVSVATLGSVYYAGYDPTCGLIPWMNNYMPSGPLGEALSCSVVGIGIWGTAIFAVRNLLKMLFQYKGWMFEQRGKGSKVSIRTRLWYLMVRLFSGWNRPMLYSFQGSLPSLPLPCLEDTMSRYLRSVRPLRDDENYLRLEKLATQFQRGIGQKLQRYLVLKSWWATNYVSDWWEEYVYLRGRTPIMVNSNFYGLDAILIHPTTVQAARAANITYGALMFRRAIERQYLEPIMIQGLVPLCSWQYERVFNTTRLPREETDRIQHLDDSTWIAVYYKGRYYRVPVYYKARLMEPAELQIQFQRILDDNSSVPEKGEEKLAALTAWDRSSWAKARHQYFSKGPNRVSLDIIEKAAFVVALDEDEYHFDPKSPTTLNHFAARMLHGNGYDRWFDKSFTLVIGKNGRMGFNAEHSCPLSTMLAVTEGRSTDKESSKKIGDHMEILLNNVRCGIYPGSIKGLTVSVATLGSVYYAGYDPTCGLIPWMNNYMPSGPLGEALSCSVVGIGIWGTAIFAVRNLLKMLFHYKGWMFEQRGKGSKVSIRTRLWYLMVRLFSGWNRPMLYSFQGSLPSLPLPCLEDTMSRYLRSVRPLRDDENYLRLEKLATQFQRGIGQKLQRYLVLKSWWATNYVSDWWEEYVYLRGRTPIMVNSNFYGLDAILIHPTTVQAARAANITYGALMFRRAIERQYLEPIMIQGLVPLCSWQYERVFNTTRLPGEETDRIQHLDDSTWIAVYYKGRYYRVPVYYKARLMEPAELQIQFQRILDDNSSVPEKGEEKLAALTAWDRSSWAKARHQYFSKGPNRVSLDIIEKAAFVVALDEDEYHFDPKSPTTLNHFAARMLHGNGYDRWLDKSFTLVIGKNGRMGFNAEHSWADAAVMSHMWEFILAEDLENGYDAAGNTKGTVEVELPQPTRLKWELPSDCLETIEYASQCALTLLNDVDLKLLVFETYGKGFMKTCKVSPDAFIQMALQLAYYRDAGRFNLTYEASMTRLFKEGRTETVRPCSLESCAWVKAMCDSSVDNEEKIELLGKACLQHQRGYQDAMVGRGIDRHLFCLYVISKYLEIDSPFLKEVLSEPWRLSTSQTPHGQTSKLDLNVHPDCISAGGGFGPVADDGYGVSYIIAGEDLIFFHVSSKKSSPETESTRFAGNIRKALQDMHSLFVKPKANGF